MKNKKLAQTVLFWKQEMVLDSDKLPFPVGGSLPVNFTVTESAAI